MILTIIRNLSYNDSFLPPGVIGRPEYPTDQL